MLLYDCSNYSFGLGVTARAMSHFFGFEYYNLPIIKIRDKRSAIKKKSAGNSANFLVVLVFFFILFMLMSIKFCFWPTNIGYANDGCDLRHRKKELIN